MNEKMLDDKMMNEGFIDGYFIDVCICDDNEHWFSEETGCVSCGYVSDEWAQLHVRASRYNIDINKNKETKI